MLNVIKISLMSWFHLKAGRNDIYMALMGCCRAGVRTAAQGQPSTSRGGMAYREPPGLKTVSFLYLLAALEESLCAGLARITHGKISVSSSQMKHLCLLSCASYRNLPTC